ncbi:MAG: hypothetical protein AAGJ35_10555, partial [Myxococcota bacterium]
VEKPLFNRYRSRTFYGRDTNDLSCLNEPATFDREGKIQFKERTIDGRRVRQEGYVLIKPYWAPNTEVKVCALDAQAQLEVTVGEKQHSCGSHEGRTNYACGCGPNLRWCQSYYFKTQRTILRAMGEQVLMLAQDLIANNKPYAEILTSKFVRINGPLAHFWRYQTRTVREIRLYANGRESYPEIPFSDDKTWKSVERPQLYSGILTMPAFLLKFATNRSRANRFYEAFLCKSFDAPPGGLPPGQDTCHEEPNLMKRCGCRYCHSALEPAASHWGRFVQGGLQTLETKGYPAFLQKCTDRRNRHKQPCRSFYITSIDHPDKARYLGYLKSYLFTDDQMSKNIESGPRALAQKVIKNGAFARCTAQKVWKWFVGYPKPKSARLDALGKSFQSSQFRILSLLKSIVTSPEYKQASFYRTGGQR